VDEVVPGYDALELDIPVAKGEMILGEVACGIILWPKKNIVFPGSGQGHTLLRVAIHHLQGHRLL
jgi:hypothetical protein